MRTTISERELKKVNISTSRNAEIKIKEAEEVAEEFRKFIPELELRYVVYTPEDSLEGYIDYVGVYFQRNKLQFEIKKSDYPKKHYSIMVNTSELVKTNHYDQSEAKKDLTEPNLIGSPTLKKVDDWIEYLTQYYLNLKKIHDQNTQEEQKFREALSGLPDIKFGYKDKKSGEIIRNGLRYSFEIGVNSISQKISIDLYWREQTLENFLLMTDSKFKKEEESSK